MIIIIGNKESERRKEDISSSSPDAERQKRRQKSLLYFNLRREREFSQIKSHITDIRRRVAPVKIDSYGHGFGIF